MNEIELQILKSACEGIPLGHQYAPLLTDASGEQHLFVVMATNQDGVHTGRRRFLVACYTCGVLIHEATTGPVQRITQHLHEYRSTP